ncbi:Modification methylase MjaI [Candidatus Anstonella stagnisolia]|nr:Modification methylase MjaI [Candidatus Anstonella stagnisolia]
METKYSVVIGDARNMAELPDESVQLVVTSPPYFNVKDYGDDDANIGAIDDYVSYLGAVEAVFRECYRVLEDGRYCCVNISDVISGGRKYPIPFHYVFMLERSGFIYRDNIIWKKPDGIGQNARSGAAKRFGVLMQNPYPMYYYPNNIYEHILIFRKGVFNFRKPTMQQKVGAMLDIEQAKKRWNTDIWTMAAATVNQYTKVHPAMFPEELPEGLIRLYTFKGETVLDPFLGSGTTLKVARALSRGCIGYEINPDYLPLIRKKAGFDLEGKLDVKYQGGGRNERG